MSPTVGQSFRHAVSLVQLMQEHITSFLLDYIIINPNFIFWDKLIDLIMSAFRKINIKRTSHQSAVDQPDRNSIFQLLPHFFVHFFSIRKFLAKFGSFFQITGASAFFSFMFISFYYCIFIGHPVFHQAIFHQ